MAAGWLVQPNAGLGGGTVATTSRPPDWVTTINDLAVSWFSLLNPPRTPAAPVVDWAQQQQQQQQQAAAAATAQRNMLLLGLGLVGIVLLLTRK